MYFPKFDWPRVVNPKLTLPAHAGEPGRRSRGSRSFRSRQIEQALASNRTTSRRSSSSRSRAKAATTTSGPSSSRACARSATRTTCSSSSTRCRPAWASPARCGPSRRSASCPTCSAFGKKTQVCGFASNDRILEEPENVFNGLLAHQLHVGRQPRRHGALPELPRDHRRGEARREREDVGEFLLGKLVELGAEFPAR